MQHWMKKQMGETKCLSGLVDCIVSLDCYNKNKKPGKATHSSLSVWKNILNPHVAIIFQTCGGSEGVKQSI